MADRTPPADLHHEMMRAIIHTSYEARRTGLFDARVDANTAGMMVDRLLGALTEWATGPDGTVALIDPATWTRYEWQFEESGGFDGTVPLYSLTPREDPT